MDNKKLIKKLFIINFFLMVGVLLAKIFRREIIRLFPMLAYIFVNEIKQQNYFQQRYIFSYLKLKKIQFSNIKISDEIFYLNGFVFFDNATKLQCLAPIIQYKIVWVNEKKNKSIILDQNYHKLNSIIPQKCVNHKVEIQLSQKINSHLWKKIKKQENHFLSRCPGMRFMHRKMRSKQRLPNTRSWEVGKI
jgi:hypothetical protein